LVLLKFTFWRLCHPRLTDVCINQILYGDHLMDLALSGKCAFVLGASKGLGFAIADALAGEGARVVLTSRALDKAKAAAGRIGHGALGVACDTGDLTSVDAAYAITEQALGGIDILVLNSGGPPPGGAQGVVSERWRAAFEAMFVGPVRMADLALPGMIARKHGRIISVISSGVIEPIANLAISNAIRPALVGWGKTLAGEVAAHGITVNAVAPGRIATDRLAELDNANATRLGKDVVDVQTMAKARIPMGRYGDPAEFAAAVVFLASARAAFMTGGVLRVDGGQIASSL
jgi:3-oxoacyl-[acyl-carrier protein] reductase